MTYKLQDSLTAKAKTSDIQIEPYYYCFKGGRLKIIRYFVYYLNICNFYN